MKRNFSGALLCVVTLLLNATYGAETIPQVTTNNQKNSDIQQIANEAYVFAYPLVTMDLTKDVMTNIEKPNPAAGRGPMGQFVNSPRYPDPHFKDVTAPNADTLYSTAWLDLSTEPYVLHVPDENGRYYLMPILDAWTNVIKSVGTRTTGTKAQDFVIVGPNWKGPTPKGVPIIKSPTNLVWILGRTYCTGTNEDYEVVHEIQAQYKLTPLSSCGKEYTPTQGSIDYDIEMTKPVRDQVNAIDVNQYYRLASMLMKKNPPVAADAPMIAKLNKLGIKPGIEFVIKKAPAEITTALTNSISQSQKQIALELEKNQIERNGWAFPKIIGSYGTNYAARAAVAAFGLGANLPEDAIYPNTRVDKDGQILNGQNKYIIHFDKNKLPPVKGFWSLTMYDEQMFFVENPLNKYTVSPRNNLIKNADGSIDIYIQHESPGADKETNWLPAPEGNFVLMFRFYWPEQKIVDGQWMPPVVASVP